MIREMMRWKIDRGYVYWWLRAPRKLWHRVPEGYEKSTSLPAKNFDTFQEAFKELQRQFRLSKVKR
jgi:hypothetical protein